MIGPSDTEMDLEEEEEVEEFEIGRWSGTGREEGNTD